VSLKPTAGSEKTHAVTRNDRVALSCSNKMVKKGSLRNVEADAEGGRMKDEGGICFIPHPSAFILTSALRSRRHRWTLAMEVASGSLLPVRHPKLFFKHHEAKNKRLWVRSSVRPRSQPLLLYGTPTIRIIELSHPAFSSCELIGADDRLEALPPALADLP
jgi:hypothetical protein